MFFYTFVNIYKTMNKCFGDNLNISRESTVLTVRPMLKLTKGHSRLYIISNKRLVLSAYIGKHLNRLKILGIKSQAKSILNQFTCKLIVHKKTPQTPPLSEININKHLNMLDSTRLKKKYLLKN